MENIRDYLMRIYGMDALSCGLILLSLLINLITTLLFKQGVESAKAWNLLNFLPLLVCLLRFFSTNHERRARANQWFVRRLESLFVRKGKDDFSEDETISDEYDESDEADMVTDHLLRAENRQTMSDLTSGQMVREAERVSADPIRTGIADEPTRYAGRESEIAVSPEKSGSGQSPDNDSFNQGRRYRASADSMREDRIREDKKAFKFFKCPACRQKIRVPKGKGKIEITCPRCGDRFIKKT